MYIQKVAEYERLEDLLEALAEEYGEAAKTGSLPRLGVEPKIGELVKLATGSYGSINIAELCVTCHSFGFTFNISPICCYFGNMIPCRNNLLCSILRR